MITCSRDKTILVWKINQNAKQISEFAKITKCLTGHSHFISDLNLTSDNNYLLSASWDREMKLWNLSNENITIFRIFNIDSHDKEIFSCFISSDTRKIISSGADGKIKLWNVLG